MSPFHEGQVWRYQTRPGEESSRLLITRVEPDTHLGTIVHVQVQGVAVKYKEAPGGISPVISHLPYDERALAASVTQLEREGATPDEWLPGYEQWKQAFDAGNAGVWTIPVAQAVATMEQLLAEQ